MHIKFILPRFHTNMFYPTKILLENNFKISIDCAYRGFNENYSFIKPKIIKESLITKISKKFLSEKSNKMNKFYLPELRTYFHHFRKDLPDLVIIRPYNFLFFVLIFILCIFHKKKLVIYNQIEMSQIINSNFTKRFFYWFLTNIMKIRLVSPLFIKKVLSKEYSLLPFVYKTSFKKKKRKFDFLLVGKLYKKKNFELYLKALNRSKKKFLTKLIFEISTDEHKKQFKIFLKLLKKYNLFKYVKYSINIKHEKIYKYYDNSKCFVLATDGDLAPVSIIEALSRGCYVLASDKCGTRNYINSRENGLIFKTNNIDSLKNSMIEISKIFKKNINRYHYDEKFFFDKIQQIIKN